MRKVISIFVIFWGSAWVATATAQDDIPIIEYSTLYTHSFSEPDEQYFAQFNGEEGDLVYVLADYVDYSSGDIEIDLRDTVGRTIGFREEYAFDPFVLAELPATALYTVVITAEEPGAVEFIVGLTGYLEDGFTAHLSTEGFQILAGVRAAETGSYALTFARTDGELATAFEIITFSEYFSENVIRVNGTQVDNWTAQINLNAGDQYVVFLDQNIFRESGTEATVEVTLEAIE
ncbi:MAG: hypothetical protein GYB65_22595 [Chloroflexi bacterium]|nr:hypothetical protein [Chloroflexota bacterium]